MKKDSYYFPHYYNARGDRKILKLRRVLGLEGYAIYFMLLEILREQTDFRLPLDCVPDLEFDIRVSKEKIESVIRQFDLFKIDEEQKFFSPKLIHYLQPYIEKSEKMRELANRRWSKTLEDKPEEKNMRAQCVGISTGNAKRVKESKGEESKVKENNSDNVKMIFEYWVCRDIIEHKKITDKIRNAIKSALKDYEPEAIKKAIYNYEQVLKGEQYFFSYKWTLKDFLKRGLDRFVDEATPFTNFLKDKGDFNKPKEDFNRNYTDELS